MSSLQWVRFSDKVVILCEVANSPQKQEVGLRFRESIGEYEGMLFPFGKQMFVEMTMAGVRFPLDMVFVKDDKIVKIVPRVPPRTRTISCDKAEAVIEVRSGFCEAHNVGVGDLVAQHVATFESCH